MSTGSCDLASTRTIHTPLQPPFTLAFDSFLTISPSFTLDSFPTSPEVGFSGPGSKSRGAATSCPTPTTTPPKYGKPRQSVARPSRRPPHTTTRFWSEPASMPNRTPRLERELWRLIDFVEGRVPVLEQACPTPTTTPTQGVSRRRQPMAAI